MRLTSGRLHCVRDSGYSAGLQETHEIMNIRTEAPDGNSSRVFQLVEFQRHRRELLGKPTGVFTKMQMNDVSHGTRRLFWSVRDQSIPAMSPLETYSYGNEQLHRNRVPESASSIHPMSKQKHCALTRLEREMLRFHDLVGPYQDNPYFRETFVCSCCIRLSWDRGFGEYI